MAADDNKDTGTMMRLSPEVRDKFQQRCYDWQYRNRKGISMGEALDRYLCYEIPDKEPESIIRDRPALQVSDQQKPEEFGWNQAAIPPEGSE